MCAGPISLSEVRINQLDLLDSLSGTISLHSNKLSVHADGDRMRSREAFDLDLSIPELARLLNLSPEHQPQQKTQQQTTQQQQQQQSASSQARASSSGEEDASDTADSSLENGQDSRFLLRNGELLLSSEVLNGGKEVHMQVGGSHLLSVCLSKVVEDSKPPLLL